MRALVIVVAAPGVEPGLGGFEAQEAAALQQFGLQRSVQPLEPAHRLRMAGAAPQRLDAEADQPDREPGRAVLPTTGIAVVGDHRVRQAVHLEDLRQPLADGGFALVRASLRSEQIARMIVENGQASDDRGKAALAFAVGPAIQREVALEIHLPQEVGGVGFEALEGHGRRGLAL